MDVNLTLLRGRGYPARLEDCDPMDAIDLLAYRRVMLATDATATRRASGGGGEPKPISLVRLRQSSLWSMTEHTVWETVNTYTRAKSGKGGPGAPKSSAFAIAGMRRYLAQRKAASDG